MLRVKKMLAFGMCGMGMVAFMFLGVAQAGFEDFFKGVKDVFTQSGDLSDSDITAGLKRRWRSAPEMPLARSAVSMVT